MTPTTLALHDLPIAVASPSEPLRARALELLAHLGARPAPPGPGLAWHLRRDPPAAPPGAAAAISHLDLRLVAAPDGQWVLGPGGGARIVGDRAELWSADEVLPLHLATWTLALQLRRRGVYVLHAAAVLDPGGGALIVGPSGSGKSTLALTWVTQGAALLSDDSVLLAGGRTLALRRGVFLEPQGARERFPALDGHLRPCPLVEASKQQVDPAWLTGRTADACPARGLVLPRVIDGPTTRVTPLPPADAFYALVRESRLAELDREGAAAHLAALASVLGGARAIRAELGRDLFDAPATAIAAIRSALWS